MKSVEIMWAFVSRVSSVTFQKVNVAQMMDIITQGLFGGNAKNVELDTVKANLANPISLIRRESFESVYVEEKQYYEVVDTPEKINKFEEYYDNCAEYINQTQFNESYIEGTEKFYYVRLTKSADYYQLSTFWVTMIVCLLTVATIITATLLWHCDHYDKDPANALLFVQEVHKDSGSYNK